MSYCETTDTDFDDSRIQIVQNWPQLHSLIGTKDKVPSEIAYAKGEKQWGCKIHANTPRFMWTKLELEDSESTRTTHLREEMSLLSSGSGNGGKRPVEIVADFLVEVKKVLFENLDNHYGPQLWRSLPLKLVVTVPAVWSDGAKDRTLQAIRQAGFNTGKSYTIIVMFGHTQRLYLICRV